jgi:hypothetical protein
MRQSFSARILVSVPPATLNTQRHDLLALLFGEVTTPADFPCPAIIPFQADSRDHGGQGGFLRIPRSARDLSPS